MSSGVPALESIHERSTHSSDQVLNGLYWALSHAIGLRLSNGRLLKDHRVALASEVIGHFLNSSHKSSLLIALENQVLNTMQFDKGLKLYESEQVRSALLGQRASDSAALLSEWSFMEFKFPNEHRPRLRSNFIGKGMRIQDADMGHCERISP